MRSVDSARRSGPGDPITRYVRIYRMQKDTLYYDGACPLCSAEIDKLARFTRGRIILKNIHDLTRGEVALDKETLLSRLHLQTADGEWITGLQANIRAWHHTPLRYLWRLLDLPLIRILSHRAYEFWLRRRAAQACDLDSNC